ncbi:MAG: hypothetical protein PVI89_04730 [Desulfobacteraceae bacterium]
MSNFQPDGRAMLIGSQPLSDHNVALELVFSHVPQIPNWVQLPVFKQEGMLDQFMAGMPGLICTDDRNYIDTRADDFDQQQLLFFEEYLQATEQGFDWDNSRFAMSRADAQGFHALLQALQPAPENLYAVKGQITGPITFCTALHDQDRRAIFYDDVLRDAAVKLLALKAVWQIRHLAVAGVPVIIFIDEPALAGFGSSEFISISKEDIQSCLQEVIDAIHDQGALAGVHVCANTDWSLLLESSVDIINFDAHGYFDRFILYSDQLLRYMQSGRFLAWGLVPTLQADQIEAATLETLWNDWTVKSGQLIDLGLSREVVRAQSFITPACGTGSLTPDLGKKVLMLTQELSGRVRLA